MIFTDERWAEHRSALYACLDVIRYGVAIFGFVVIVFSFIEVGDWLSHHLTIPGCHKNGPCRARHLGRSVSTSWLHQPEQRPLESAKVTPVVEQARQLTWPAPTPRSEPEVWELPEQPLLDYKLYKTEDCNTCVPIGDGGWACTSMGCGVAPLSMYSVRENSP